MTFDQWWEKNKHKWADDQRALLHRGWCACAEATGNVIKEIVDWSGYDLSKCMACDRPVVCVPDGMPMCEPCAAKEDNYNDDGP